MGDTYKFRNLELKRFLKFTKKVVLKFEFDDLLNLEPLQKYLISGFILH